MILLDTHVWIWLVHDDPQLPGHLRELIEVRRSDGIAVSAISCWEIAKLIERGRLELPLDIHEWMDLALAGSGIILAPLSPVIAIASTMLPGDFHRDPADQIIVATSRVLDIPLGTCDQRIVQYPHVKLLSDSQIHDG